MREHSFKRAALFGVLGALIFLVIGIVLCEFWGGLRDTVLFGIHPLHLDLRAIEITVNINLFVIIGFLLGWAYCLFRGTRRSERSDKDRRD